MTLKPIQLTLILLITMLLEARATQPKYAWLLSQYEHRFLSDDNIKLKVCCYLFEITQHPKLFNKKDTKKIIHNSELQKLISDEQFLVKKYEFTWKTTDETAVINKEQKTNLPLKEIAFDKTAHKETTTQQHTAQFNKGMLQEQGPQPEELLRQYNKAFRSSRTLGVNQSNYPDINIFNPAALNFSDLKRKAGNLY